MPDRPVMAYPRLTGATELTPDNCRDVPISAVGLKCRSILAMRLDVPQLLLGPSGHRDWRGLALLAGFSCDDVELLREQGKSPTGSLLDQWEVRSTQHVANIGQLVQHLMCLERYDVLNDTSAELYHVSFKRKFVYLRKYGKIPKRQWRCCPFFFLSQIHYCYRKDIEFYRKKQSTEPGDVIQEPMNPSVRKPIYDAFVCYTSDDWPAVEALVDRLESLGFRLFLPNRDLKAGVLKYATFYELMEKWCRKTIIVFSPAFLLSEECRVQRQFIESINIEATKQKQQKLIPVIIKQCKLDGTTRMFSKINLCDDNITEWSWNKLVESIRCCNDSVFVSVPHSSILPPSLVVPPSVVCPDVMPGREPEAMLPPRHDTCPIGRTDDRRARKSVLGSLKKLFVRKSRVSSASSGFQSMALPE